MGACISSCTMDRESGSHRVMWMSRSCCWYLDFPQKCVCLLCKSVTVRYKPFLLLLLVSGEGVSCCCWWFCWGFWWQGVWIAVVAEESGEQCQMGCGWEWETCVLCWGWTHSLSMGVQWSELAANVQMSLVGFTHMAWSGSLTLSLPLRPNPFCGRGFASALPHWPSPCVRVLA